MGSDSPTPPCTICCQTKNGTLCSVLLYDSLKVKNMMHIQRQVASALNGLVAVAYEECCKGVGLFTIKSGKLGGHRYIHTLKFSKPVFSNTWTVNFQMFKLVLEKAEEPEIKLLTYAGSLKKQDSSRKTSISALLTMPKAFDCMDHNKLENSEKYGNTRPPDLLLEKHVCRSGNNS